MGAPNEITPNQLLRLIGTPDCPLIVDVSIDPDFDDDPFLIPGAFRHRHTDPNGLAEILNGQKAVIVCQKGKKLSQGMSAWLRTEGIAAEYLKGGNFGWRDTTDAPRIPYEKWQRSSLWVTRHRPKIDRIACPWLIRRFVKPDAKFLFVAPGEVAGVAEKFNAESFDIEGGFWSHRGKLCTFDVMLQEFGLNTEPLLRMAEVVRAADTNTHDKSPQAAGLLAISVGLSRMYRDDVAQLEAGIGIYDALFRWARDGFEEGHDWPQGHGA